MKKYSYLFLAFILLVSCQKEADEAPGISIYKTKGDYYSLATIGMKGDRIFRISGYSQEFGTPGGKLIVENSDTIYKYRRKLTDDYVLGAEADEKYDVFLSLSHKEILVMEHQNGVNVLPPDTFRPYILDSDPYVEFYRNKTEIRRFRMEDSLEINDIIKNGELLKYFEKIK